MLRYERCSPVMAKDSDRITQVVKVVRSTRIGAVHIKMVQVAVAATDMDCSWLERMRNKLVRAA